MWKVWYVCKDQKQAVRIARRQIESARVVGASSDLRSSRLALDPLSTYTLHRYPPRCHLLWLSSAASSASQYLVLLHALASSAFRSGTCSIVRRQNYVPDLPLTSCLFGCVDLGGHAISMGAFGFAGYWAYKWDVRAGELLAAKRAEIAARRGITPEEILA